MIIKQETKNFVRGWLEIFANGVKKIKTSKEPINADNKTFLHLILLFKIIAVNTINKRSKQKFKSQITSK